MSYHWFLTQLPTLEATPFQRLVQIEYSTFAANAVQVEEVWRVRNGQSLVLFDAQQDWLYDGGVSPGGVSVAAGEYAAATAWLNAGGKIGLEMLSEQSQLVDALFSVFDGGVARQQAGFLQLGTNMLKFGETPTAVYLRPSERLNARWTRYALPVVEPDVLQVRFRGYTVNDDLLRLAQDAGAATTW